MFLLAGSESLRSNGGVWLRGNVVDCGLGLFARDARIFVADSGLEI